MKYFLAICICLTCFGLFNSNALAAFYDSSTGTLHLSAVFDGEKTWLDAVITLHPDGTYSIDGEESVLPFRCESNFDEQTLTLISEGMNPEEINDVLGCRWSYYSSNRFSLSPSETYTWVDSNCTQLHVSPDVGNQNLFHESLLYVSSCDLNPDRNGLYDLTAPRFIIQMAVIDDIVAAPDVILEFNTLAQTIKLISAVEKTLADPPEVCGLFSQDILDTAVGSATTLDELANIMGCQWTYNIVTTNPDASSTSQVFWDHECNSIFVFIDQNSGLISGMQFDYRQTGCGF